MQDGKDVAIPLVGLLMVEPANNVHLCAAVLDRLAAAVKDLLVAHHIAAFFSKVGAESTKRAAIDADVGGVEVGVDVVVAAVAVFPFPHEVGELAKLMQVDRLIPQALRFSGIQPLARFHLLANRIQGR